MTLDTIKRDGFTVTFTIEPDSDGDQPWDNCDGHGPVSEWRSKRYSAHYRKAPGELVLCDDGTHARFYDFAAACKLARKDRWGLSPYKLIYEHGANALTRATAHYFDSANNLSDYCSDWHDDINAAIAQVYAMHRATMTAREYAALAARADYDRLAAFCDGQWDYRTIVATVTHDARPDIKLANFACGGIESDSPDSHFAEIAADLASDAIDAARESITAINSATE